MEFLYLMIAAFISLAGMLFHGIVGQKIYMGKILIGASKLAKMKNIHESGYRLITNCNKDGGQEIDYLHFHLIGGEKVGKMVSYRSSSFGILKKLSTIWLLVFKLLIIKLTLLE